MQSYAANRKMLQKRNVLSQNSFGKRAEGPLSIKAKSSQKITNLLFFGCFLRLY